jgi:hypothetical protein
MKRVTCFKPNRAMIGPSIVATVRQRSAATVEYASANRMLRIVIAVGNSSALAA